MSKKLLYKLLVVLTGCAIVCSAPAQNHFRYSAALDQVDKEAFYKIPLSPKIIGMCLPQLADLRVLDEKGNQVPFMIKSDMPVFNEKSFIEFPILSNRKEADRQTHVVIKNLSAKSLNCMLLLVKNTEAKRLVTLSGSDDAKQWFVIKENIFLDNYFSDSGSFVQTISFPPASYQYFQVTINGQNILPVNITKAGIYRESFIDGEYVQLPAPLIEQHDSSDKNSYVKIAFDERYQVDKLEPEVTGPKFFNRSAEVFSVDGTKMSAAFELNSRSPASYPIRLRAQSIMLVISNEDNPPLQVTRAKGWQLNQYLLAWLEAGKKYTVYFGDSTMTPPKYDLALFRDSIGKNPGEIHVGKIETITKPVLVAAKPHSAINTVVLWIVIVLVLMLLLTLTLSMIREVNKHPKI